MSVDRPHTCAPIYLLGMEKQPRYILSQRDPANTSQRIAAWWLQRWVLGRIQRDEVLERLAQHTLVHPVRHGARIILPRADLEQPLLFENEDDGN